MSQNKYYSEFAKKYRNDILNSSDPSLWTTDILSHGPVSERMRIRITTLKNVVNEHFSKEDKIFDIGCGFGRQAYVLAMEGFKISGTDTNRDFIDLANEIFRKHSLHGNFFLTNPEDALSKEKFRQVVLLEVLEHIPARRRREFLNSVRSVCTSDAKIIVSIPRVKKGFSPWLLNVSKYILSSLFRKDEHPYLIPGGNSVKRLLGKYFIILKSIVHDETLFYICKSI